jgi:beta-aspartyl-dipeptidase (metallo-type)
MSNTSLMLIQNGDVYAPEPLGKQSVLLANSKILKVGMLDPEKLQDAGLDCEVIDANGCIVTPGLIDPHEHLIGAGGEEGFGSRMPEVTMREIALAGITTVVGLLGTDTTTRDLKCLHAKCCQLWDEGITAYMYSGGFELPPKTLQGSIVDDIVMIDKIIGAGEIAIADSRWLDPELRELALLVKSTVLAGKMSTKAGVTHFHTGPGEGRLSLLHELLDTYEMPPESIYATHITRSEALMDDAIALARRGAYVDMDTTEENLGESLRYYWDHDGAQSQLTVSSDAHTPSGSPSKLYGQFVSAVREYGFALEEVLPLFTANTARVLKLSNKGGLQAGKDADVLVLSEHSLELVHVFARGRQLVKDGQIVEKSEQEQLVEEAQA